MKKIFALILALMLCFCAFAEPRTIDLETMTAEELEALRAEVDAAIDALNADEPEEEPDESDEPDEVSEPDGADEEESEDESSEGSYFSKGTPSKIYFLT